MITRKTVVQLFSEAFVFKNRFFLWVRQKTTKNCCWESVVKWCNCLSRAVIRGTLHGTENNVWAGFTSLLGEKKIKKPWFLASFRSVRVHYENLLGHSVFLLSGSSHFFVYIVNTTFEAENRVEKILFSAEKKSKTHWNTQFSYHSGLSQR